MEKKPVLTYPRILLKVSGEGFARSKDSGIDAEAILKLAHKIEALLDLGVELAVVVGGGNFVRGAQLKIPHIQAATADYMGMLATLMNALALQDTCESIGLSTRVQSSIEIPRICEPWIRRRALRHLEKGRVVILGAGTGNPHFSTDTAAAQRAIELDCNILIKATQVDGIYDSDPNLNPEAQKYQEVSYNECLRKNLRVMDATAIALCREHALPIMVLNIADTENLLRALTGRAVGTLVTSGA